MKITELLTRPIAFHRPLVALTGSVKAAIMLSQAIYWQPRATDPDGWWYKTAEEWEAETGLTRHEQDGARKDCEKYLKSDLRGVPARLYWKVEEDALTADLLDEKQQSSLPKTGKLVSRKSSNINKKAETTTQRLQQEDIAAGAADPPKRALTEWQETVKAMSEAICAITGDDLNVEQTKKRVGMVAAQLLKAGYAPVDLPAFLSWWRSNDWRGKAGQRPTRELVLSELPRSKSITPGANGLRPNPDEASRAWVEKVRAEGGKL